MLVDECNAGRWAEVHSRPTLDHSLGMLKESRLQLLQTDASTQGQHLLFRTPSFPLVASHRTIPSFPRSLTRSCSSFSSLSNTSRNTALNSSSGILLTGATYARAHLTFSSSARLSSSSARTSALLSATITASSLSAMDMREERASR